MESLPELTPDQFQRFADLVRQHASIHLKPNKLTLLSNRLRKRLRALELLDFESYYEFLTGPQARLEIQRFIEVVTTNESYFWRTESNFQLLRERLLPDLLDIFTERNLSFWSAGCSTGEEPYNLAMELNETMKRMGYFMYQVIATDISEQVIDFARRGVYVDRKIERIPPAILRRYFRPVEETPGAFEVRSDVKEHVTFRVSNLFKVRESPKHCIFCRNVMIYFDREKQEELVDRFFETLHPGGYLVIGHSESLQVISSRFESRYFPEGTAYQRPRQG